MTRPRPTGFEDELERRLAIPARGDEVDRRLPKVGTIALAAITAGSFAIALITGTTLTADGGFHLTL